MQNEKDEELLVGDKKEWENYILACSIFISHTVETGNKARPYNKWNEDDS